MSVLTIIIPLLVLAGLWMMSRVSSSVNGNRTSILAMILAILVAFWGHGMVPLLCTLFFILIGLVIGFMMARKVKMIEMPEMVGLLNGLGGGASALVGIVTLMGITSPEVSITSAGIHADSFSLGAFESSTGVLAVIVGMITLVGSLIAAGKLHRVIDGRPKVIKNHSLYLTIALVLCGVFFIWSFFGVNDGNAAWIICLSVLFAALFGGLFTIRVGGADMPITISLLNSLSGVAGSIAGMAIGNVMLVAIGGIVGASGLLLTQIMCRAMNRSLGDILLGKTAAPAGKKAAPKATAPAAAPAAPAAKKEASLPEILHDAKKVIIVPGYGMALAQAQHQVKQLADTLRRNGAEVRFAIHPVAGRMPGHMNVLLAEADVPYDDLFEMERINDDFKETDLVIVIGANDVLNPAAREAEGTPIYGMPVLNVDQAKHIVICNYDLKPGYAGVENPLYTRKEGVTMCLGDAKETVADLVSAATQAPAKADAAPDDTAKLLHEAKEVIIVPGYGMALAQAQHEVKHLADALTRNGAHVRFAIHPVAGRMPGHMNVLLAEADVPYDDLFEMERINDDFKSTDLVVVIGANDVLNPAAREAEGTPIYGMPVLNVDQAKHIIICNYDLKPGYAGVENPLYTRKEGVTMCLGDAKETVGDLLAKTTAPLAAAAEPTELSDEGALLHESKRVIIVPGYGMALAQAQHEVKGLADTLRRNGAEVRFAIHPVAGRMPGHMNVLLAEADVPYDDLFEMERINDDFKETDLVIVIGANDVLNPAAREAEGTPIYGMPVLNVDQAKHIIICNYDLKPGYAGVENPLYTRKEGVTLKLGDAKETVAQLAAEAAAAPSEVKKATGGPDLSKVLTDAKKVIIVPGSGMALAQAQHLVKQLADTLTRKGAEVRFAIHPVAGRMPGHMNVLLAEADVPYDDLFEMERINDDFKDTDLVIVIGANDVLNPAAREAEGTPIYGMPVLNVDQAKYVIICNYDLNPGYAGVPNPLYERESGVTLLLGDANKTVADLVAAANA
ncbi:MAG: NAD(P)(+) transhydrogenase (Re/Si-specific) subunit beta [Porphyromonas sp.]|nr:NAD(P)(+) transhydrogenase (Re/Si-specific) subunit beta [Porphyromonas sp.]MDY6102359.1 NAD(P)(+) transhydrogenase (Re/Si-specific) subunit beta [Porphyromonas sp.]